LQRSALRIKERRVKRATDRGLFNKRKKRWSGGSGDGKGRGELSTENRDKVAI
jgi:hypothetical protein